MDGMELIRLTLVLLAIIGLASSGTGNSAAGGSTKRGPYKVLVMNALEPCSHVMAVLPLTKELGIIWLVVI